MERELFQADELLLELVHTPNTSPTESGDQGDGDRKEGDNDMNDVGTKSDGEVEEKEETKAPEEMLEMPGPVGELARLVTAHTGLPPSLALLSYIPLSSADSSSKRSLEMFRTLISLSYAAMLSDTSSTLSLAVFDVLSDHAALFSAPELLGDFEATLDRLVKRVETLPLVIPRPYGTMIKNNTDTITTSNTMGCPPSTDVESGLVSSGMPRLSPLDTARSVRSLLNTSLRRWAFQANVIAKLLRTCPVPLNQITSPQAKQRFKEIDPSITSSAIQGVCRRSMMMGANLPSMAGARAAMLLALLPSRAPKTFSQEELKVWYTDNLQDVPDIVDLLHPTSHLANLSPTSSMCPGDSNDSDCQSPPVTIIDLEAFSSTGHGDWILNNNYMRSGFYQKHILTSDPLDQQLEQALTILRQCANATLHQRRRAKLDNSFADDINGRNNSTTTSLRLAATQQLERIQSITGPFSLESFLSSASEELRALDRVVEYLKSVPLSVAHVAVSALSPPESLYVSAEMFVPYLPLDISCPPRPGCLPLPPQFSKNAPIPVEHSPNSSDWVVPLLYTIPSVRRIMMVTLTRILASQSRALWYLGNKASLRFGTNDAGHIVASSVPLTPSLINHDNLIYGQDSNCTFRGVGTFDARLAFPTVFEYVNRVLSQPNNVSDQTLRNLLGTTAYNAQMSTSSLYSQQGTTSSPSSFSHPAIHAFEPPLGRVDHYTRICADITYGGVSALLPVWTEQEHRSLYEHLTAPIRKPGSNKKSSTTTSPSPLGYLLQYITVTRRQQQVTEDSDIGAPQDDVDVGLPMEGAYSRLDTLLADYSSLATGMVKAKEGDLGRWTSSSYVDPMIEPGDTVYARLLTQLCVNFPDLLFTLPPLPPNKESNPASGSSADNVSTTTTLAEDEGRGRVIAMRMLELRKGEIGPLMNHFLSQLGAASYTDLLALYEIIYALALSLKRYYPPRTPHSRALSNGLEDEEEEVDCNGNINDDQVGQGREGVISNTLSDTTEARENDDGDDNVDAEDDVDDDIPPLDQDTFENIMALTQMPDNAIQQVPPEVLPTLFKQVKALLKSGSGMGMPPPMVEALHDLVQRMSPLISDEGTRGEPTAEVPRSLSDTEGATSPSHASDVSSVVSPKDIVSPMSTSLTDTPPSDSDISKGPPLPSSEPLLAHRRRRLTQSPAIFSARLLRRHIDTDSMLTALLLKPLAKASLSAPPIAQPFFTSYLSQAITNYPLAIGPVRYAVCSLLEIALIPTPSSVQAIAAILLNSPDPRIANCVMQTSSPASSDDNSASISFSFSSLRQLYAFILASRQVALERGASGDKKSPQQHVSSTHQEEEVGVDGASQDKLNNEGAEKTRVSNDYDEEFTEWEPYALQVVVSSKGKRKNNHTEDVGHEGIDEETCEEDDKVEGDVVNREPEDESKIVGNQDEESIPASVRQLDSNSNPQEPKHSLISPLPTSTPPGGPNHPSRTGGGHGQDRESAKNRRLVLIQSSIRLLYTLEVQKMIMQRIHSNTKSLEIKQCVENRDVEGSDSGNEYDLEDAGLVDRSDIDPRPLLEELLSLYMYANDYVSDISDFGSYMNNLAATCLDIGIRVQERMHVRYTPIAALPNASGEKEVVLIPGALRLPSRLRLPPSTHSAIRENKTYLARELLSSSLGTIRTHTDDDKAASTASDVPSSCSSLSSPSPPLVPHTNEQLFLGPAFSGDVTNSVVDFIIAQLSVGASAKVYGHNPLLYYVNPLIKTPTHSSLYNDKNAKIRGESPTELKGDDNDQGDNIKRRNEVSGVEKQAVDEQVEEKGTTSTAANKDDDKATLVRANDRELVQLLLGAEMSQYYTVASPGLLRLLPHLLLLRNHTTPHPMLSPNVVGETFRLLSLVPLSDLNHPTPYTTRFVVPRSEISKYNPSLLWRPTRKSVLSIPLLRYPLIILRILITGSASLCENFNPSVLLNNHQSMLRLLCCDDTNENGSPLSSISTGSASACPVNENDHALSDTDVIMKCVDALLSVAAEGFDGLPPIKFTHTPSFSTASSSSASSPPGSSPSSSGVLPGTENCFFDAVRSLVHLFVKTPKPKQSKASLQLTRARSTTITTTTTTTTTTTPTMGTTTGVSSNNEESKPTLTRAPTVRDGGTGSSSSQASIDGPLLPPFYALLLGIGLASMRMSHPSARDVGEILCLAVCCYLQRSPRRYPIASIEQRDESLLYMLNPHPPALQRVLNQTTKPNNVRLNLEDLEGLLRGMNEEERRAKEIGEGMVVSGYYKKLVKLLRAWTTYATLNEAILPKDHLAVSTKEERHRLLLAGTSGLQSLAVSHCQDYPPHLTPVLEALSQYAFAPDPIGLNARDTVGRLKTSHRDGWTHYFSKWLTPEETEIYNSINYVPSYIA